MDRRQTACILSCALLMTALGGCGSSPATTQTSSSAKGAPAPIKAGTADVNGKQESILTDPAGMTVYYFEKDTRTSSACTNACTSSWPPLLAKAAQVTTPAGLPGSLTVVKDQNGDQLAYDGHLLYTYAGDSSPGQANGEGLAGEWWAATPSLGSGGAATGSSGSSW